MNTIECIEALDLLRSLPDRSVDMILTDPPYRLTQIAWDKKALNWPALWKEINRVSKVRAAVVMTSMQPFTTDLINSNRKYFRYGMVWVKNMATGFLDANRRPLPCHEDICVFGIKRPAYYPKNAMWKGEAYKTTRTQAPEHYNNQPPVRTTISDGDRYPITTFKYGLDKNGIHKTQKPLGLFKELIAMYTQPGELVIAPFCGSGTTALAAQLSGRNFICGDNDPECVISATQRFNESDPYAPVIVKPGIVQTSLFGGVQE